MTRKQFRKVIEAMNNAETAILEAFMKANSFSSEETVIMTKKREMSSLIQSVSEEFGKLVTA